MFKLKITHTNTYSELSQPNPLRWRIMLKKGDTLHSQSGLIKCKDFFNDVVAWKQAKRAFNIYRFDNKITFNREGLYLHLTSISDVTKFLSNLSIVNERLEKDLGVRTTVHVIDSSSVSLCVPNKVWKTTYYVSVLTMLIRVCNYSCLYEGWDDIFSDVSPMTTLDGAFPAKTRNYVAKKGFKLPLKFRKFWYNGAFGWNSESNPNAPSNIIHNNGAVDWVSNMGVV